MDRELQKRWIKAWFKAARLGEVARCAVIDARFGPSRCAAKTARAIELRREAIELWDYAHSSMGSNKERK